MKYRVILDTDPGVDDAMAIALCVVHPEIELMALTTVFGNVSVEQSTRNAQYVLDVFGSIHTVVSQGEAQPVIQPPRPHSESVHGDDGLGNCYDEARVLNQDAAHANLHPLSAADYIIEQTRQFPGEITLIAVGPLSNVAQALAREPQLPALLRGLIIMGGALDEPGNVTPVAEANFFNDPHAADQVLAVDWPATVIGLDVTHKIMVTDSQLARLRDEAGNTGKLLWESSRFYVDFYVRKGAAKGAAEPSCAMHDAAAVLYLLMPEAFGTVAGRSRVVDSGIALGQLTCDRKGYDYSLPHWKAATPSTAIALTVNADLARQEFLEQLCTHHLT